MTMKSLGMVYLRIASLCLGLIASLVMTGWAHADDGYQNEVLADSPILYYQFNEDPGALQVVDSSGNPDFGDPANGGKKDSQFLGTRSKKFTFEEDGVTPNPGDFFPGQGIFLGVAGPVGRAVEFHDPDDYLSTAPGIAGGENLLDGRGNLPGGYIETGLHKNFGPASTTDWSVEFLHRDDMLQPGDNNTEVIFGQAKDGGEGLNTFGTAGIDFTTNQGGAPGVFTDEREVPATGNTLPEFSTYYGQGRTYANETQVEGQWRHVVITFDASTDLLRWYINGVMTSEQVAGDGFFPSYPDLDSPLLIGSSNEHFGRQYFDGWLDEFAVYDKRLDDPNEDDDTSDSRIQAHFNELDLWTGIAGGFDSDRDVDGADFLRWQRGHTPGRKAAPGQLKDDNLELVASPEDLLDWQANFGSIASSQSAFGTVPEPTSLGLLTVAGIGLLIRRRRR